jgi:hypothetical protein
MTPGAVTYVPLSSKLCVRIDPSGARGIFRRQIDGRSVRAINACQLKNSERYIFGSSESLVMRLTKSLNNHCLNLAVNVIREATSDSEKDSTLVHTFTKSRLPSEMTEHLP